MGRTLRLINLGYRDALVPEILEREAESSKASKEIHEGHLPLVYSVRHGVGTSTLVHLCGCPVHRCRQPYPPSNSRPALA